MNGIMIYVILFVLLFLFLNYNYYREKSREEEIHKRQEEVCLDDFFYCPKRLAKMKRRKIWLHIPTERNSRVWADFGSRSSNHLNLSVMNLCIKSILDWCASSYDIIIYHDQHIGELLGLDIDLTRLSGEELDHARYKYNLEILYLYGGVQLPPTLYLRNNFKHQDVPDRWFVCDRLNTNVEMSIFGPSAFITGSPENDPQLRAYLDQLLPESFQLNYFREHGIFVLDGSIFGTKNTKGDPILLEDLFSNQKLRLPEYHLGVYLPYQELLSRNTYKWFCKMSERQVLSCQCALSYYILDH
jgi:hypothetical protein